MIFWCLPLVEPNWQVKGKRTHGWSPLGQLPGTLSRMKEWIVKYIQAQLPFKRSFMVFIWSSMLFVAPWIYCSQGINNQKRDTDREPTEYEEKNTRRLAKRNQISWSNKRRQEDASSWDLMERLVIWRKRLAELRNDLHSFDSISKMNSKQKKVWWKI